MIKILLLCCTKIRNRQKRLLYLLLFTTYFIRISYGIQQKMTDDLYSYVLFTRKNSLLKIGKHKRCSLSIYHTSFDPHQLHYSKATFIFPQKKKEILHDRTTSGLFIFGLFKNAFYFAQICKMLPQCFSKWIFIRTKRQFKCYSNGFQSQSFKSFYLIYIRKLGSKVR